MTDDIAIWAPTIAIVIGGFGLSWRFGGIIVELKTLLGELTKDVIEIKIDVKSERNKYETLRVDLEAIAMRQRDIASRLLTVEQVIPKRRR